MKREEDKKSKSKIEAIATGGELSQTLTGSSSSPNVRGGGLMFPVEMHRGYIKVWRKIIDSPVFQDSPAYHVFSYLLVQANWNPDINRHIVIGKEEVTMRPGQVTIGRFETSSKVGLPPSTVRNALKRLKEIYKIVDTKSDNKKTLVTILNWNTYQNLSIGQGQENGQREDNERTTRGHSLRIKESKNKIKYNGFAINEPPKFCQTCEKYFGPPIEVFEKHIKKCRVLT